MTAEDQARYLQEALAIARGTKSGGYAETRRLRAFGRLFVDVLDALIWLENDVSEMPTHLYEQWGGSSGLRCAREAIQRAGAWTEAEEIQANLMREREAELGPDLPSRDEREADEIASEFMDVPVSQGPHGVFSVEKPTKTCRGARCLPPMMPTEETDP